MQTEAEVSSQEDSMARMEIIGELGVKSEESCLFIKNKPKTYS